MYRPGTVQVYRRFIAVVGRVKHYYFIATAGHSTYRHQQRFGSTAGHGNVLLRAHPAAVTMLYQSGDLFT